MDQVFIFDECHLEKVLAHMSVTSTASVDWTTCALRTDDKCVSAKRTSRNDHRKTRQRRSILVRLLTAVNVNVCGCRP